MRIINIIFILVTSLYIGSISASDITNVSYRGKYNLEVNNKTLTFKNGKIAHEVQLNKCNRKYLEGIASYLKETKSKNRFPSKSQRSVQFKLNGKDVTTSFGSNLHKNLEKLPKKMQSYMSLMRKKCE